MMKIGLNTNTFAGEQLDVLLPLAKEFGICYLELWGSNLEPNGKKTVNGFAFSIKKRTTGRTLPLFFCYFCIAVSTVLGSLYASHKDFLSSKVRSSVIGYIVIR